QTAESGVFHPITKKTSALGYANATQAAKPWQPKATTAYNRISTPLSPKGCKKKASSQASFFHVNLSTTHYSRNGIDKLRKNLSLC
ncbi:hypothetical protein OFC62_23625, partial [Escherichia coli]|nr:hypothetical protein [Escherichia coli]